jgi:hypothetical protein
VAASPLAWVASFPQFPTYFLRLMGNSSPSFSSFTLYLLPLPLLFSDDYIRSRED